MVRVVISVTKSNSKSSQIGLDDVTDGVTVIVGESTETGVLVGVGVIDTEGVVDGVTVTECNAGVLVGVGVGVKHTMVGTCCGAEETKSPIIPTFV